MGGGARPYSAWVDVCYAAFFISDNFATPAALAELWSLLSAVLVVSVM